MEIISVDALPVAVRDADFSFEIEGLLDEPFEAAPSRVTPVLPRTKTYGLDPALLEAVADDERGLFIASEDGVPAGYVAVRRDWNGCALIADFAVARPFRRRGLATSMMNRAVGWARRHALNAMRLETQSNNVAAIGFYQRYGFVFGGYDRFLYRETGPETAGEVALFWYLSLR